MLLCLEAARDYYGNRTALFDGIEEGGIRASHEIDEHDNDSAMEGLQDRVIMPKGGNDMDSSRGILSRTMDKFKMVLISLFFTVFETKSSRRIVTLVAAFVVIFLIVYYLTKGLP
ncbi:hypothetical protein RHMOL_Rhmol03G0296400 [Rhododendron molle]|uniref:Uncharacterized protein n=1 Tax=Rhododendron molle TaxID=49168 RepID=A0ACC0PJJ3_RHOML|nr:hypothetical protein RHMOL_Rhmol03G0296400 [Rhododendron molle]